MSIGTTNIDSYGGLGGYGGGIGGIGLFGLLGINNLFGQNGFNGNNNNIVADQNISELRKDVQEVDTNVQAGVNDVIQAISAQSLGSLSEFRNITDKICETEKMVQSANYAQTIQQIQSTQAIQAAAVAFNNETQSTLSQVKQLITADGDATRALINQNEIQNLRDQLAQERRRGDSREVEISINNTANATQSQNQAQFQAQTEWLNRRLDRFDNQIAKASQDIINVGGVIAGASQTANPVNVK